MFIPLRLTAILTVTVMGGLLLWGLPSLAVSQDANGIEGSQILGSSTYDPGDVGNPDNSQGAGSRFMPTAKQLNS